MSSEGGADGIREQEPRNYYRVTTPLESHMRHDVGIPPMGQDRSNGNQQQELVILFSLAVKN
jgi:hypothetical protein